MLLWDRIKHSHKHSASMDLTTGPVGRGIIAFTMPIFWGQLLQQLYNVADAWVVGNFADNSAFAAVSSSGNVIFLIIGFFNGMSTGGGVVISRYFGAKDKKNVVISIHTNFLFGAVASVGATILGLVMVPQLLVWMKVPAEVMPDALMYFRIYFAGVSTVIMYNICMAIMRALGDSIHPLYYLIISSVINVFLDLVFVAGFHWGVTGAAVATVFSQGLSMVLCIVRMCKDKDYTGLDFKKLTYNRGMMRSVLSQGLPAGIQNSVISIGNVVVQTNINAFGAYAMSGVGAYSKLEGFVFLPIMSLSLALPTFISQNLGAAKYERAKKGALFGIVSGMVISEAIGVLFFFKSPVMLRFFVASSDAIRYGMIHARTVSFFFCLLSFSHCAAGVLRGCGKSIVPMVTMLTIWCGIRIIYVTTAISIRPQFQMISWAYPLTWSLSSIVFVIFLLKSDWTHAAIRK